MKKLDISLAEALDIIKTDELIDQGKKINELNAEQRANAKQKQTRKPKSTVNTELRELLKTLAGSVGENVTIINIEHEFEFERGGKRYRVRLSAPRT